MDHLHQNARYLMGTDTQIQFAKKLGVNQSSVSRLISDKVDPSFKTVHALAAYFRVSLDDLVNRDLQAEGPSQPSSHPTQLDLSRLGLALTAIDKALQHMVLQGRLGTLAESVKWAYAKAFYVKDPDSRDGRELYDELVASHLGGTGDDRRRAIEAGTGEDRPATAKGKTARRRR